MTPTKQQIDTEIDALIDLKHDTKNEEHKAAMEAQIQTLNFDLTFGQIEALGGPEYVTQLALEARDWAQGEITSSPSNEWKHFLLLTCE